MAVPAMDTNLTSSGRLMSLPGTWPAVSGAGPSAITSVVMPAPLGPMTGSFCPRRIPVMSPDSDLRGEPDQS